VEGAHHQEEADLVERSVVEAACPEDHHRLVEVAYLVDHHRPVVEACWADHHNLAVGVVGVYTQ